MKQMKYIIGLVIVGLVSVLPASSSNIKASSNTDSVVLSKDNVIVLNTQVDGESTAAVISKAKELDLALSGLKERYTGKKPLYIFLNTPGGSIQSGLEMIEALNGLGRPVNTITLFAASMGFQIAQNLGDRLILRNGVLMSHRAKGGFEGEFGGQFPSQVDSRFALWNSRINELDQKTVGRTNGKQTLESYRKQYANEMWLTGSQSVAQGYADKVVNVKCDKTLDGVTTHELSFLGIPIQYDLDNCPLNTSPMNIRISIPTTQRVNIDGKEQKVTNSTMDLDKFLAAGGGFGRTCLEFGALCASDPYLTLEHLKEVKTKFVDDFTNKKDKIVPLRW
jgi:ATP-dependent Clp protease, protease subunit